MSLLLVATQIMVAESRLGISPWCQSLFLVNLHKLKRFFAKAETIVDIV